MHYMASRDHVHDGSVRKATSTTQVGLKPTRNPSYAWLVADKTGLVFGRWTVVGFGTTRNPLCRCLCGVERRVPHSNLASGRSQGCLACRALTEGKTRRLARRSEYEVIAKALRQAIQRCYDPQHPSYHRYGARGIRVCPEWRGEGGAKRFYMHIGPKPDPSFTLERLDNNRGYEPGNVAWRSRLAQARNQERTREDTRELDDDTPPIKVQYEEYRDRVIARVAVVGRKPGMAYGRAATQKRPSIMREARRLAAELAKKNVMP